MVPLFWNLTTNERKIIMSTEVKHCMCRHDWQDKKYGDGKRVCNSKKDGGGWRCTSCGKDVVAGATTKKGK
jgi:hypothetical protein